MIKNLFILIVAFALVMVTGCDRPTGDKTNFAYRLDWNNAGIDVQLIYTHPDTDTVTLSYSDPLAGGQADIFTCVKNLRADGASLLADSVHSKIQLFDFQKNPIVLNYRIEQSLPDTDLDCPREVFRPNLNPDMLYALGDHIFLGPDEESVNTDSIPIQVEWGRVPDFPVFCLYNPGKGTKPFSGILDQCAGTFIVGDPLLQMDTVEILGVNNYVVTAPKQLADYNNAQLVQFFKTFYAAAVRFWGDKPNTPYTLMVYPFQKIPFEVTGLGQNGGFLARYSADADTILNFTRKMTFAHEIGHNWIGLDGDRQWFGEGFNEFQTIYLITASGMETPECFIDFFNNYLDELYHFEIRNMPNDEIREHFWEKDYWKLPYMRGSIYALRLMGVIEQQTGTEHAFKDLMMAMKPFKDDLTAEQFIDVTSQFVDRQWIEDDLNRYIIKGETMTLDGDPMPTGCEIRHKEDGTPYLVLTDEETFMRHFVL